MCRGCACPSRCVGEKGGNNPLRATVMQKIGFKLNLCGKKSMKKACSCSWLTWIRGKSEGKCCCRRSLPRSLSWDTRTSDASSSQKRKTEFISPLSLMGIHTNCFPETSVVFEDTITLSQHCCENTRHQTAHCLQSSEIRHTKPALQLSIDGSACTDQQHIALSRVLRDPLW